jgi:hypothetical protein
MYPVLCNSSAQLARGWDPGLMHVWTDSLPISHVNAAVARDLAELLLINAKAIEPRCEIQK